MILKKEDLIAGQIYYERYKSDYFISRHLETGDTKTECYCNPKSNSFSPMNNYYINLDNIIELRLATPKEMAVLDKAIKRNNYKIIQHIIREPIYEIY